MNKDTISAMSIKNKEPYNPNNPDSVADFWDGARIEYKGKTIGAARRLGERGLQKKPKKIQVTLRLSPDILEHFKDSDKGWQTRIKGKL